MTESMRRNRQGGAWLGLLLLVVAVAIAGWIFLTMRSDPAAEQGGTKPTATNATKPAPGEGGSTNETAAAARRAAEALDEKYETSAGDVDFDVVCLTSGTEPKPLAGIEITAAPATKLGVDLEHAVTGTTDATGVARFEKLGYSIYDVSAAPAGYYPLRLRGAKDGKRYELIFGQGAPVSGIVTDSVSGKPVGNAYVQARSDLGMAGVTARIQLALRQGVKAEDIQDHDKMSEPMPFVRVDATTGPDGRFAFPSLPIGFPVTISVEHEEFENLEDSFTAKEPTAVERTLALQPRIEIFGRVVADESGEPIIGAKVQAGENGMPINAIILFGQGSAAIFEDTSNANGEYRLRRVTRGKQCVSVRYPGYEDYVGNFEVKTAEPYQHEIRLKRAASLTGQVVDNAENPIEGVEIYWVLERANLFGSIGLPPEPHGRTGADGTFSLRNLPVGKPFNVLARHHEFVNTEQDHIVLQAGEMQTGVKLVMNRGGAISGTVVDSMRQPLAGATILARPVRPAGAALAAAISAADGTFMINNTQPAIFELTAELPGFCKFTLPNVRDEATGVQFVMVKEAVYSGRLITDVGSDPVQRFRVRIRPAERDDAREVRTETFRDKEGKFVVKGLSPGLWDFEFTADAFAPVVIAKLAVREGEKLENQEVRLRQGSSVVGIVKSLTGKPIQSALVRMDYLESFSDADKTYATLQTSTNSNGEYEIKNLVPGKYKIWVSHPMFAPTGEREVAITSEPKTKFDFNLPKPAQLRVIIRDEEGNTVPGATCSLFQGDTPFESAEKGAQGGMVYVKLPTNSPERSGVGVAGDPTSQGGMRTRVGESGELTYSRKEPGKWTLWVIAEGFYKYTAQLDLESGKEIVHEAIMQAIKPGLSPEDALKPAKSGKPREPTRLHDPDHETKGRLAPLSEEEKVVLAKKRRGEQLTPEETKTYREARKKLNQNAGDEPGEGGEKKGGKGKGGKGKGAEGEGTPPDEGAKPGGGR